ncbi:phage head completion protein [Streptococcus pasteurianus]|uniref:phage head completion protein n=1 Tax=Streptococcus pasteurianus TaxID=197614 RepID=UPI000660986D|nr:head-tail adaptor protein [Streptococcus pasteurianus]QBX27717.1 hypothetical protein Javan414_0014 [Streptococcus phage Javan414]
MLTRKMNVRITIFKKEGGQNEDGEVLDNVRTDIMSCWAEVSKTTVKDFRENTTGKQADNSTLTETSDTKVFLIRYMPKPPFDNSMFVDFYGLEYKIEKMEVDYANKEMIMISGVRIT